MCVLAGAKKAAHEFYEAFDWPLVWNRQLKAIEPDLHVATVHSVVKTRDSVPKNGTSDLQAIIISITVSSLQLQRVAARMFSCMTDCDLPLQLHRWSV